MGLYWKFCVGFDRNSFLALKRNKVAKLAQVGYRIALMNISDTFAMRVNIHISIFSAKSADVNMR